jgi:hypothetical protein
MASVYKAPTQRTGALRITLNGQKAEQIIKSIVDHARETGNGSIVFYLLDNFWSLSQYGPELNRLVERYIIKSMLRHNSVDVNKMSLIKERLIAKCLHRLGISFEKISGNPGAIQFA